MRPEKMDEYRQWKGKGAAPFLSFNRLTQARLTRSMNRESQLAQGEGRRWWRCRRRPGDHNRSSTRNSGWTDGAFDWDKGSKRSAQRGPKSENGRTGRRNAER